METLPITARSFEKDYHINGDNFERSYKEAHGRKGCLVAIVKGTKAKEVTSVLKKIPEAVRLLVEEMTLDFSDSMHQIVSACFPKAMITLDRFHHQQFCLEALQELRIGHRREVMTEVANARDDFRAQLRGVIDKKSFIFRLVKIFG